MTRILKMVLVPALVLGLWAGSASAAEKVKLQLFAETLCIPW